jgi:hypothetical protein
MSSNRILGIEDMRGSYEIIDTRTFFCNDDEEVTIQFHTAPNKYKDMNIVFSPTNEKLLYPPIQIQGDDKMVRLIFKGWNHANTYAAIEPVPIGDYDGHRIYISVYNVYLMGTNRMDIQVYRKVVANA